MTTQEILTANETQLDHWLQLLLDDNNNEPAPCLDVFTLIERLGHKDIDSRIDFFTDGMSYYFAFFNQDLKRIDDGTASIDTLQIEFKRIAVKILCDKKASANV